ncbi:MAG: Lrp/AsnC family transcriptional regulator [Candidatus Firestonebacteria bacterium]
MKLTKLDKKIINALSSDLPESINPYKILAQKFKVPEDYLIKKILLWKKTNLIRRIGATIRHNKAGFLFNVMFVCKIPDANVSKIGMEIAKFPQITHCYERLTNKNWQYNLYAMVHGKTKKECKKNVDEIVKKLKIHDYKLLYTLRELKKTSIEYF